MKYNILYSVLAPKLSMLKGLVNSRIQKDAYLVIKYLSEYDQNDAPPELMPTFGACIGLPLKQDLKDILSRYKPPKVDIQPNYY